MGLLYSDQNNIFLDGTSIAFRFYFGENLHRYNKCDHRSSMQTFNLVYLLTPFLPPYSPTTCDGYQYQERNQRDYSVQLQLTSSGDQRLRWQTGLYYLNID